MFVSHVAFKDSEPLKHRRMLIGKHQPRCLLVDCNRIAYTRLLTSSHRLRVETGRWEKPRPTPRHQRICYICKKLDDEYHFVLECQALQNLRKQLIPREYLVRSCMEKFIKLLNSEDSHIISKTAEFARKGFHMRENGYRYPHYISILSYIDNHMLRL